jgi:exodeoxyribonuclease VII small subunit
MSKGIHFEQSIAELEELVKQLERGELTLEDSLKQFEKGIALARRCQEVLTSAEQKITMLTREQSSLESSEDEPASD